MQQDISGYETGGFAGLLNYDLSGFYNRFGDDASRFGSANTEVGFNAGDWIVRSRQVQTWQDGLSRSTHLQAYAQRTFASHQAVLQAGQINLYNPVLSGAQITGVQVLTEHALQEQGQGALIQGIANSPAGRGSPERRVDSFHRGARRALYPHRCASLEHALGR